MPLPLRCVQVCALEAGLADAAVEKSEVVQQLTEVQLSLEHALALYDASSQELAQQRASNQVSLLCQPIVWRLQISAQDVSGWPAMPLRPSAALSQLQSWKIGQTFVLGRGLLQLVPECKSL